MNAFGSTIRKLREDKVLPLRTVADYIGIDQAILSKIERGQRRLKKEQVIKLAQFFNVKETQLLIEWLSDSLVIAVQDEDLGLKALQLAEQKVKTQKEKVHG